jgi:hypothetical protein
MTQVVPFEDSAIWHKASKRRMAVYRKALTRARELGCESVKAAIDEHWTRKMKPITYIAKMLNIGASTLRAWAHLLDVPPPKRAKTPFWAGKNREW